MAKVNVHEVKFVLALSLMLCFYPVMGSKCSELHSMMS